MPQRKVVDRYRNIEHFFVEKNGQVPRAFHEGLVPRRREDFDMSRSTVIVTSPAVPLELVAYEQIGDSRYWYSFAELNWPIVEDPLVPEENRTILVPSADQILR